jgi:hypothetical protein
VDPLLLLVAAVVRLLHCEPHAQQEKSFGRKRRRRLVVD